MESLRELKKLLKPGQFYHVMFKFRGLVVKRKLKLLEYDAKEKFIVFQHQSSISKLLPVGESLYVLVPGWDMYIKTNIFSERKGKLYLYIEGLTPPPPFVNREYVRVEPDPNEPVRVKLNLKEKSLEGTVKDISEVGVGVIFDRKDLSEEDIILMKDMRKFKGEIHLPKACFNAVLNLEHITDIDRFKILMGFSIDAGKVGKRELQRYIFERQREIAKELSNL